MFVIFSMFTGEIISLFVALSWTATALFAEVASKRMGSLPLNTLRMTMSLTLLSVTLWLMMGTPWPRYADGGTWMWLALSKIGLEHYYSSFATQALSHPVTQSLYIPFAATFIRASVGLVGFFLLLRVFNRDWKAKLRHAATDRRAMWCLLGATVFGPFIGVSASLLATMYTSTGIAQTLFALTPVLIIAPSAFFVHEKVTLREVLGGGLLSVIGVSLFFL